MQLCHLDDDDLHYSPSFLDRRAMGESKKTKATIILFKHKDQDIWVCLLLLSVAHCLLPVARCPVPIAYSQ